MVLGPKFGNSSASIREIFIKLKTNLLEGWSSFKFNNLGLAVGMALKFYNSVGKALKLKVKKCWGLILTFVDATGKKLVGSIFTPAPILNRVKKCCDGYIFCTPAIHKMGNAPNIMCSKCKKLLYTLKKKP